MLTPKLETLFGRFIGILRQELLGYGELFVRLEEARNVAPGLCAHFPPERIEQQLRTVRQLHRSRLTLERRLAVQSGLLPRQFSLAPAPRLVGKYRPLLDALVSEIDDLEARLRQGWHLTLTGPQSKPGRSEHPVPRSKDAQTRAPYYRDPARARRASLRARPQRTPGKLKTRSEEPSP